MADGAFNQMAADYDDVFTNSLIGKLQRTIVWEYLYEQFDFGPDFKVLELNCGTAEDACMFAQKGSKVTATDISSEMLSKSNAKAEQLGVSGLIEFQQLNIDQVSNFQSNYKYDLVFSNFGGLNCVSEQSLAALREKLTNLLTPQGRFVAVVMPSKCMMETLYFLSRFNWKSAFRRGEKKVDWKNDQGDLSSIYYYSPKVFEALFEASFSTEGLIPVGFFVPPSYTETFFKRHQRILGMLEKMDCQFKSPTFSGLSDHFLIDLKIKN